MASLREVLSRQNAYKTFESEGVMDAYFYRPAGAIFALAGKHLGLSPNHLTLSSLLAGVTGAWFLCWDQRIWQGAGLLILSGIFDASDGQLARMTGSSSLAGRILDGASDYIVYLAIYIALGYKTQILHPENSLFLLILLILAAGISHSLQSSLFDYYRNAYTDYVDRRRIPQSLPDSDEIASLFREEKISLPRRFLRWSHQGYSRRQGNLARPHVALGEGLRKYYPGNTLDEKVSGIYRRLNLPLVRLWNLMGANSRLMVMLVAVAAQRPELYFWMELTLYNVLAVLAHRLQIRADEALLTEVRKGSQLSG